MNDKKFLSQRIRPNSEAAPWVVEEVKKLEAHIATLEARLAALESHRSLLQLVDYKPAVSSDCGCPVNTICNNSSCPRAMRVTCAVSTKEIEN